MRKNEDYAVETLKQSHFICLIAAAAALSACSSAGEALGDALTPSPAPKGHYRTLKIEASQSNTLLPDADSSITITDSEKQGAERTKTYRSGDGFDMGNKLLDRITELEYERKDGSGKVSDRGKLVLYRQDYSAVAGLIPSYVAANGSGLESGKLHIAGAQGEHTRAADIPQSGEAHYTGSAFAEAGYGQKDYGKLDYTVNFATRKGRGSISGLPGKSDITLEEAALATRPDNTTGVDGNARSADWGSGSYNATLFGPKYNELAGGAYFPDSKQSVGMAGKKQ